MVEDSEIKTEVDIALEEDRKESEARTILQDMERLKSVPADRKRRWIWELLQNAKDCGLKEGTLNTEASWFQLCWKKIGLPFPTMDCLLR
ncbi:MAG: hypothetical protein U0X58_07065 [Flavobacteriaceae bacterium]